MVMAPANTGNDNNSTAVITTAHTNNGIRSNVIPCGRMLITVVIKFKTTPPTKKKKKKKTKTKKKTKKKKIKKKKKNQKKKKQFKRFTAENSR
jgi:hypothetical protein